MASLLGMQNTTVFSTEITNAIHSNPYLLYLILLELVLELIFYIPALYKSAERKQTLWFGILFAGFIILNDFGVLPLLYLIFYRDYEIEHPHHHLVHPSRKHRKKKF
jgi:hypothetical protein